jgi:hypothetical protein
MKSCADRGSRHRGPRTRWKSRERRFWTRRYATPAIYCLGLLSLSQAEATSRLALYFAGPVSHALIEQARHALGVAAHDRVLAPRMRRAAGSPAGRYA